MNKKLLISALAISLLANPCFLYANEPLSLTALIETAKKDNPEILAAKKRWEASLSRIPQAKSLDNPSVGISFGKIPSGTVKFGKTMAEDRILSISQMFPFFGKLSLKGKIALVESQMIAGEYKDKELDVINAIKNAYYDLFLNHKEIKLNEASLQLLLDIAKVAEANYLVKKATQEEVRKIDLEIAQLSTLIANLKEEKLGKETLLNTLLNKDPESAWGAPTLRENVTLGQDINTLYALALQHQPELAIFSYAIERNKNAVTLAKKSIFPDVMSSITLRGISSGGIGPWDLMLAFSLPFWFWTKQRYEIKEAISNLEEAKAAFEAMKNKTFANIKTLYTQARIAKNKMNLYEKNSMPILESAFNSSLASYRAGTGEAMMLIDTDRMLIETEMNYYKALVDYYMRIADLERVIGINLSEVSDDKK